MPRRNVFSFINPGRGEQGLAGISCLGVLFLHPPLHPPQSDLSLASSSGRNMECLMGECWEENKAIYCSNAVLEAAEGPWEPSSLSQSLT